MVILSFLGAAGLYDISDTQNPKARLTWSWRSRMARVLAGQMWGRFKLQGFREGSGCTLS